MYTVFRCFNKEVCAFIACLVYNNVDEGRCFGTVFLLGEIIKSFILCVCLY